MRKGFTKQKEIAYADSVMMIGNNPKVLIIDDEVDICYLLKGILRYKDIEAEYALSLDEARKILVFNEPDIIFLDNHLSDGLGVNFIKELKKTLPKTVLIMITAHDTVSDRDKAFSEGIDYFIGKPFTRSAVLQVVEKIIL